MFTYKELKTLINRAKQLAQTQSFQSFTISLLLRISDETMRHSEAEDQNSVPQDLVNALEIAVLADDNNPITKTIPGFAPFLIIVHCAIQGRMRYYAYSLKDIYDYPITDDSGISENDEADFKANLLILSRLTTTQQAPADIPPNYRGKNNLRLINNAITSAFYQNDFGHRVYYFIVTFENASKTQFSQEIYYGDPKLSELRNTMISYWNLANKHNMLSNFIKAVGGWRWLKKPKHRSGFTTFVDILNKLKSSLPDFSLADEREKAKTKALAYCEFSRLPQNRTNINSLCQAAYRQSLSALEHRNPLEQASGNIVEEIATLNISQQLLILKTINSCLPLELTFETFKRIALYEILLSLNNELGTLNYRLDQIYDLIMKIDPLLLIQPIINDECFLDSVINRNDENVFNAILVNIVDNPGNESFIKIKNAIDRASFIIKLINFELYTFLTHLPAEFNNAIDNGILNAAYLNDLEAATILVNKKASLDLIYNAEGESIIHMALKNNNLDMLKLFFDKNHLLINLVPARRPNLKIPLIYALTCKEVNIDTLGFLLAHPDLKLECADKPILLIALENSSPEKIRRLIQHPDLKLAQNYQEYCMLNTISAENLAVLHEPETLLIVVQQHFQNEDINNASEILFKLYEDCPSDKFFLFIDEIEGDPAKLQLLFKKLWQKIEIFREVSLQHDQLVLIKLFRKLSEDYRREILTLRKEITGYTLLHLACMNRYSRFALELIKNGADSLDIYTPNQESALVVPTPLLIAAKNSQWEIIIFLINSAEFKFNSESIRQLSEILFLAAKEGEFNIVRQLIAKGVSADIYFDRRGESFLHYVLLANHTETLETLFDASDYMPWFDHVNSSQPSTPNLIEFALTRQEISESTFDLVLQKIGFHIDLSHLVKKRINSEKDSHLLCCVTLRSLLAGSYKVDINQLGFPHNEDFTMQLLTEWQTSSTAFSEAQFDQVRYIIDIYQEAMKKNQRTSTSSEQEMKNLSAPKLLPSQTLTEFYSNLMELATSSKSMTKTLEVVIKTRAIKEGLSLEKKKGSARFFQECDIKSTNVGSSSSPAPNS